MKTATKVAVKTHFRWPKEPHTALCNSWSSLGSRKKWKFTKKMREVTCRSCQVKLKRFFPALFRV